MFCTIFAVHPGDTPADSQVDVEWGDATTAYGAPAACLEKYSKVWGFTKNLGLDKPNLRFPLPPPFGSGRTGSKRAEKLLGYLCTKMGNSFAREIRISRKNGIKMRLKNKNKNKSKTANEDRNKIETINNIYI